MKVGDRVRVLAGGEVMHNLVVGEEYIISEHYINDIWDLKSDLRDSYTQALQECQFELVNTKIDNRFDVQREMLNKAVEPILLKDHNFRYDAYMETRDQILEKKFAERRQVAQNVYDELIMEERIKVGL